MALSAATETLKGEIGASSMKTRILKGKLTYVRHIISERTDDSKKSCNELLKKVVLEMFEDGNFDWIREMKQAMNDIGLKLHQVSQMKDEELKKKIKDWDTDLWRNGIEAKKSLEMYKEFKSVVKEEEYDNSFASVILYRARCNVLNLGDRKRFQAEETTCIGCGHQLESLNHFLLDCPLYEEARRHSIILQRPHMENQETSGKFLFPNSSELWESSKEVLKKMWNLREQKRIAEAN